jgi:outer membrane receptor protein involved in Fe transport
VKIRPIVFLALAACFVYSSGSPIVQAQEAVESNDSGPPQNSNIEPQPAPPSDVADLDVSQLMNMKVTSVSKKEQKLSHVAAAIFVITQEDIRRSGATSIPDLLRMVPGTDVAQIDASSWAISVRGFNHQFSDKLPGLVRLLAIAILVQRAARMMF